MAISSHAPVRTFVMRLFVLLAVGSVVGGIVILLTPTALTLFHHYEQAGEIATYNEAVAQMDDSAIQAAIDKAAAFNASLPSNTVLFTMEGEDAVAYNESLDPAGTGVMGYVRIPKLDLSLPIYHGTSSAMMLKGACHVEGTALPTGEPSTHAAITAHRGEPGASYFKDLDQLTDEDTFEVTVLNTTTVYQVDQIVVVEPDDLKALESEQGTAFCTLITCTPYQVNSHRLLVRGRCVDTHERS